MKTRIKGLFVIVAATILLTGCWDYRGLDEMTIVTGIAIDIGEKEGSYLTSFEIIDIANTTKESATETIIIESSGDTIMQAIRNAGQKIKNKLYFSHSKVLVLSKDVIERDGISLIVNSFSRDEEIRETLNIIISDEKTAKEILKTEGLTDPIISFEIKHMIKDDNQVVGSTKNIELFKVFNTLKSRGTTLALPLVHLVKNDTKLAAETKGLSIFNKDKIIGSLTPLETKYYLFILNCIEGGIINLDMKEKESKNTAIEIRKSDTQISFNEKENKIKFTIKTKTEAYLDGIEMQKEILKTKEIKKIRKIAEEKIKKSISDVINKSKKIFKTDIFNLGEIIYKKDHNLWNKVRKKWDEIYINSEVEVISDVLIINSALIK